MAMTVSGPYRRRRQFGSTQIGLIAIVVFAVLGFGGVCAFVHGTKEDTSFRVKKTEIKRYGSGEDAEDKYLVFTDKGVFENTDQIVVGKCDSSDVHNQIEKGKCYKAKVYGFRWGCTSSYKNIISVQEIPCAEYQGGK